MPIAANEPKVIPAVNEPEKTYNDIWLSKIVIGAPDATSGYIQIHTRYFDSVSGELDPDESENAAEDIATNNNFVGSGTGLNCAGDFNTAIGVSAFGNAGATADNNVAVGYVCLSTATTCQKNTVIGNYAAYSLTGGNENFIGGYTAGYSIP